MQAVGQPAPAAAGLMKTLEEQSLRLRAVSP